MKSSCLPSAPSPTFATIWSHPHPRQFFRRQRRCHDSRWQLINLRLVWIWSFSKMSNDAAQKKGPFMRCRTKFFFLAMTEMCHFSNNANPPGMCRAEVYLHHYTRSRSSAAVSATSQIITFIYPMPRTRNRIHLVSSRLAYVTAQLVPTKCSRNSEILSTVLAPFAGEKPVTLTINWGELGSRYALNPLPLSHFH